VKEALTGREYPSDWANPGFVLSGRPVRGSKSNGNADARAGWFTFHIVVRGPAGNRVGRLMVRQEESMRKVAIACSVLLCALPVARADFTDDFSDGDANGWVEVDLSEVLSGGQSNPFSMSVVEQTCPWIGGSPDYGLLGQWSDFDPGVQGSDDIAVAVWTGEGMPGSIYANASLRMRIRYSCHVGALACDPFFPGDACNIGVNSEQVNNFILFRNLFLITGSYDSYAIELHDSGNMGIIKAVHIEAAVPPELGTLRIKETWVGLDLSRDVWMRAEIQTRSDGGVRIRGRVWQDDLETPGDGTEDEPCTWDLVGDDLIGRDPFENSPEIPDAEVNPYPPGLLGIGWNEDDEGTGSMSNMTLDDVTVTAATRGPGYKGGDFDCDGDVDVNDFAVFQACFNGASAPAACP